MTMGRATEHPISDAEAHSDDADVESCLPLVGRHRGFASAVAARRAPRPATHVLGTSKPPHLAEGQGNDTDPSTHVRSGQRAERMSNAALGVSG